MSKKFMELAIKFLDTLYNNRELSVKTPKIKEMILDERFKNVIPYLIVKDFIRPTWKDESNNDVSPQNISHVHLKDPGMEFLRDYKNRKVQNEFNRIIAFTAAILALIGIYTFIKDLGFIDETNNWIKYIFLIFVVIAIGPIISFIVKSYYLRT